MFEYDNRKNDYGKHHDPTGCNTSDNNGILHSRVYIFRIQRKDQFALLARNTQDLEERFFTFTDKVNTRALDIGIRYPIKLKRGENWKYQTGES